MITKEQNDILKATYNPEGSALRDYQYKLLDTLVAFDKFCSENNIKYSLAAGTLLGAVRHKGFIPWDDDADVIVTRDFFNKILSLKKDNNQLMENLYLNRPLGSISWMLQLKNERCYVDLFIVDNVPDSFFKRLTKRCLVIFLKLLGKAKNHYNCPWTKKFKAFKLLTPMAIMIPIQWIDNTLQTVAQWDNYKTTTFQASYLDATRDIGKPFVQGLFNNYMKLDFEGASLMSIVDVDKYLKVYYGDYMQLPNKILTHNRIR